jgi:hypothetical protein
MAKENYVYVIGQLRKEPFVVKNKDTGRPTEGAMFLTTIRRGLYDAAGNFSPRWDKPLIRTKDPRLAKKMLEFKVNDIIEAKCCIVTHHVKKIVKCPDCGTKQERESILVYLTPVSLTLRNRPEGETAATAILMDPDVAEMSNIAHVIGRVCNEDGVRYTNDNAGHTKANYQIAVNRKFMVYGSRMDRLSTDDETQEDRADYPWVVSYGKVADDDKKQLVQGSLIYIDGYVHTQTYKQKTICDNECCQQEFEFPCQAMQLTPYSNEYLEGCNLVDSVRNLNDRVSDDTMELDGE